MCAMALPQRLRASVRSSKPAAPSKALRMPVLPIRAQALPSTGVQISTPTSTNGNGVYNSQPINVNVPEPIPGFYAPPKNYANLVEVGVKKSKLSVSNLIVSGILAGMYIGVGGFLVSAVLGGMQSIAPQLPGLCKLLGGLIFPVGLTLVTLSGTELYTGNTAVIPMSVYEKKTTWGAMFHNWFWSYTGNFIGSILMVALVAATGILAGNPVPVNMATMKTSIPFWTCLARATVCNWLVCMAVWNAASATSVPGKMLGLWGPIATFVTIGLEHSVANMWFIPMGIVLGAKVSFTEFLVNNLLPVTLGNTLGGFLFVGTAFAFIHGSLGKKPAAPAPASA